MKSKSLRNKSRAKPKKVDALTRRISDFEPKFQRGYSRVVVPEAERITIAEFIALLDGVSMDRKVMGYNIYVPMGTDTNNEAARKLQRSGYNIIEDPQMKRRMKANPTGTQSILFDKSRWTPAKAKAWLKKHGHKYGQMDSGRDGEYWRFQQFQPNPFATIPFGKDTGIKAIVKFNPRAGGEDTIDPEAVYEVNFDFYGTEVQANKFHGGPMDHFTVEAKEGGGYYIIRWIRGEFLREFLTTLAGTADTGDEIFIRNNETGQEYEDWGQVRARLLRGKSQHNPRGVHKDEGLLARIRALVSNVEQYYTININGEGYNVPRNTTQKNYEDEIINDVLVYLSDKDFLEKHYETLSGKPFAENFTADDFDEDGHYDGYIDVTQVFKFTTRDGGIVFWDFNARNEYQDAGTDFGADTPQARELEPLLQQYVGPVEDINSLYQWLTDSSAIRRRIKELDDVATHNDRIAQLIMQEFDLSVDEALREIKSARGSTQPQVNPRGVHKDEGLLARIRVLVSNVEQYYTININGEGYDVPRNTTQKNYEDEIINDVLVYLSDKDFLEKHYETLSGKPFAENFTADDFDEDGHYDGHIDVTQVFKFTTRDGGIVFWDFNARNEYQDAGTDFGADTPQARELEPLLQQYVGPVEDINSLYQRLHTDTAQANPRDVLITARGDPTPAGRVFIQQEVDRFAMQSSLTQTTEVEIENYWFLNYPQPHGDAEFKTQIRDAVRKHTS